MNLREAIEQLGQVVEDIKQAVVVDDKNASQKRFGFA